MTTLLMCIPEHFDVTYNINPWMPGNIGKVDQVLAFKQWYDLYSELSKYAKIELIKQDKDCPDMVFTANAGLVIGNKAILSNFKTEQRKKEEPIFAEWFLENGYVVTKQAAHHFEGAGDFLHVKDEFDMNYYGHGIRSSIGARHFIRENLPDTMGQFYCLKLIDPRFYHLDTCFCPINKDLVMYYPGAFQPGAFKYGNFDMSGPYDLPGSIESIELTEQEALQFGCNAIVLGNEIFMPECHSLVEKLQKKGYNVHTFDMSEFMKAGGACKCLVLEI